MTDKTQIAKGIARQFDYLLCSRDKPDNQSWADWLQQIVDSDDSPAYEAGYIHGFMACAGISADEAIEALGPPADDSV